MSETKWTKGPWTQMVSSHMNDKKQTPVSYTVYAKTEPYRSIANIEFASGVDAEDKANANLMAAAPELYEALKLALTKMAHTAACGKCLPASEWSIRGSWDFSNCKCEIATIKAALKKARGEQ